MMRLVLTALAAASLLGACSSEKANEPVTADASAGSTQTLASALSGEPGFATLGSALKDTGLAAVFDATASYTVLAPSDDAFAALGDTGKALLQPDQRAALAAVLRGHVLPGYTTPQDIEAAITAAKGKPVKMATMGNSSVTFARQEDTITVTTPDGVTAKFAAQPVLAGNGVAIPIDAVLKAVPGNGATPATAR